MMEEDTDLREGSTEQQPRDKQEFRLAFLFSESYPPESPSLERAPWPSSLITEFIQKLYYNGYITSISVNDGDL